jgi:hypothetical protein
LSRIHKLFCILIRFGNNFTNCLSTELKQLGHEAGHPLPYSAEVNTVFIHSPYVFMEWFLINETQGQFYLLLSVVGIALGYGLDSPDSFPGSARFSVFQGIQTDSGAYSASYPIGGGKAAWAWS